MSAWQRTQTCGDLREAHLGQTATLNGWVLTTRNFGNQVFIDLRDRYGLTQVVFEADDAELFAAANKLGREYCISVTGLVRRRIAGKERADIATGQIEVCAKGVTILNDTYNANPDSVRSAIARCLDAVWTRHREPKPPRFHLH